jgi:hypothetical protein
MTNTGIARITNRYLNDVNDPVPGQTVSTGEAFSGQVGAVLVLNASEALKVSDTGVSTLYGGKYQYVQFYGSQSGTTVVGGPVYWEDPDNFIVTADVPTNGAGFAGVALNVVTKGNYGFIQVAGKAALHTAAVTNGSPAIGDPVSTSTIGIFDDVAAANMTNLQVARIVGVWTAAPANNTTAANTAMFAAVPNAS